MLRKEVINDVASPYVHCLVKTQGLELKEYIKGIVDQVMAEDTRASRVESHLKGV